MSKLNANAPSFHPVYTDEHALFLTFSNGFPLSEMQIFNFFNRQLMIIISYYPSSVERVNVHTPMGGRGPSLFGKIVFRDIRIPALLMGNKERISFLVEGHHLYCKRFVSQPSQPSNPAASASNINSESSDGGTHSRGEE
ncbi:unnamed protein product [Eruca vesicaria subsp. sativa]|uniref:Uncharacterized protein n=1 Tax=Eruca vesicaria subsp. sativa TaxID=29727 RepID=A0ABC8IYQ0_ERUVS|nr:unnamed protein product [Eruca vesicaria subsp. sativa]